MAQVASNTERCFLRVSGNPLQVLKLIQWVVLLGEFVEILSLPFFSKTHLYFLKSKTIRLFLDVLKPFLQVLKMILLLILLGEFFEVVCSLFIFSK